MPYNRGFFFFWRDITESLRGQNTNKLFHQYYSLSNQPLFRMLNLVMVRLVKIRNSRSKQIILEWQKKIIIRKKTCKEVGKSFLCTWSEVSTNRTTRTKPKYIHTGPYDGVSAEDILFSSPTLAPCKQQDGHHL